MKFGEIRKPLLIFCLSASVALHCGAVWIIHSHPLLLKRDDTALLMKSAPEPKILTKDCAERLALQMEKALEESLNQVIAVTHFSKPNQPIAQEEATFEPEPPAAQEEQSTTPEFAAALPPLFDPEGDLAEFALDNALDETSKSEPLAAAIIQAEAPLPNVVSIAQLTEDDYTMTDEQFSPDALPTAQKELAPQLIRSLKKLKIGTLESGQQLFTDLQENSTPQLILPNSVDFLRTQWTERSIAEISLPDLEYYGLAKTSNLHWQEDLDVEVTLMPDPAGNKYIFSLTIHPEFEEDCKSMKQNFYFVIDRSSSIEKHKLSRFKMAVQRSLAALCEGDNFNIYFFDKYVTKLSEKNLAVSPRTIQMAEDFIEQEREGTKVPYRSLETLIPTQLNPNELHSIILITDGGILQNAQREKKFLSEWLAKGERNVNFFTAAAGKGNELVLLDLLSYATAGKLLYSDTNAGFPRKMVQMVKNLHNPIVKDLSIEVSPSASNAKVELHPQNGFLPPMFSGQPYTITGSLDELCDLTIFIQGKNHDKYINVRKRISFKEVPSGGRALEKTWAETQAKICYEHFLESGKALYLKQAEQIVAPFHGDIATIQ